MAGASISAKISLRETVLERSGQTMNVAKPPLESRWHLAQFKPNCARIAKRNLARQGFETFLPLESRTRVLRGKFVDEIRPFFPGYIFVGTEGAADPMHAIHSTYGISQLVCFGNRPALVPQALLENLMARCDDNCLMRQDLDLESGGRVRLATGPFASQVGEVVRASSDRRVWLLLDVMGQRTKVSVTRSDLGSAA